MILLQILDVYTAPVHSRYKDKVMLWDTVYITSVFPPEILYDLLVSKYKKEDSYEQLKRRIDFIVYCWKDNSGYHQFELPMSAYKGIDDLRFRACGDDGFRSAKSSPFEG